MSAFYCLFQSNIFKLKNLKIFEKIEIDEKSKVSKSFDLILWYNLGINIQYKYHVFEFKNFTQVNKIGKLIFFCLKKIKKYSRIWCLYYIMILNIILELKNKAIFFNDFFSF